MFGRDGVTRYSRIMSSMRITMPSRYRHRNRTVKSKLCKFFDELIPLALHCMALRVVANGSLVMRVTFTLGNTVCQVNSEVR